MSAIQFERHITRFEVLNQCILLEDDKKLSFAADFKAEKFIVRSEGRDFVATIREFYVNDKFKPGLSFDHSDGHISEFFFERSIAEGKIAKFNFDAGNITDGVPVVDLAIVTKTKVH